MFLHLLYILIWQIYREFKCFLLSNFHQFCWKQLGRDPYIVTPKVELLKLLCTGFRTDIV